jgi:hypothetical protein
MNFKDWDGDISKLSENATRGLLPILRKEAARQEAEEARAKLPGNQSKALPAAVKQELVEQITAESEAGR